MAKPITRAEQFLQAIAENDPSKLPTAITRMERFYRALGTGEDMPTPVTSEERFLQAALAFKGDGGGTSTPSPFYKLDWSQGDKSIPHEFGTLSIELGEPYITEEETSLYFNNTIGKVRSVFDKFYSLNFYIDLTDIQSITIPTKTLSGSETYGYPRIMIGDVILYESFESYDWVELTFDVSGYTGSQTLALGFYQPDSDSDFDRGVYYGKPLLTPA